jgi:hypothetical protein
MAHVGSISAWSSGGGLNYFAAAAVAIASVWLSPSGADATDSAPDEPVSRSRAVKSGDKTDGDEKTSEDEPRHEGWFSRISLGIGYGRYSGNGRADPIAGVKVIEDPSHAAPALKFSADSGHEIVENFALHFGFTVETLLTSDASSSIGGFYLFGLGGGLSYYLVPNDWYLTGQVRWLGALLYLPDGPCSFLGLDKLLSLSGIGLSLSFGKEWFSNDGERGIGLSLQLNYGYLRDKLAIHYWSIMLVPTLTRF